MTWQLREGNARWDATELGCQFHCAQPRNGLTQWRVSGEAHQELQLCALEVPGREAMDACTDAYVRGADLFVSYPPRSSDQVAHSIYYRGLSDPAGIEMLVSAETKLLESAPQMAVCHRGFGPHTATLRRSGTYVPADDGDWELPGELPEFFLIRPTERSYSWMVLAHPQDLMGVSWRHDTGELKLSVFPESLEKGVIRRARFQLRLLARERDEAEADAIWGGILRAAPPLAT